MDSFSSLMMTLYVIAICSGVLFFLGLLAEIIWPWWEDRKPKRQATYRD